MSTGSDENSSNPSSESAPASTPSAETGAKPLAVAAVSYSEILYDVQGGVAQITLNRPERRNPIGASTVGELLHALHRAKHDPAVKVVVLTGAGKVFSAGGDLSQMLGHLIRVPHRHVIEQLALRGHAGKELPRRQRGQGLIRRIGRRHGSTVARPRSAKPSAI